jgi:PmbA protein
MRDRLLGGLEAARRLGASAARLSFEQRERIGCTFENGRLKAAHSNQNLAFQVEAVVRGKRAATTGNRPDEVAEMVGRAVTLAQLGSAAHFDAYPAPAPVAAVPTWSERTMGLPRQGLIEACRAICDRLRAYDRDLYLEAGAHRSEAEGLLVTSGGVCHETRHTFWSLGAWAQRTRGTDMVFAGEGRAWKDLNDLWDPEAIAGETVEDLRRSESGAEAPSGPTAALLAPPVLGMLLQAVILGVSGRNVAKGDSPLKGRLGERILDPSITLHDNPHLAYAPGSAEMDADGIPAWPLTIVREGVLEAFLYDLDSAGLAGARPTGHTGCSPWSAEVLAGPEPHERLLSSIEDGLYVKGLIGFGQSNLINGDFSANVALGWRVRGGRTVGRVKNVMIAGNVYELLRSGVALSRDRHPVARLPWARVEGLSVSAAPAAGRP